MSRDSDGTTLLRSLLLEGEAAEFRFSSLVANQVHVKAEFSLAALSSHIIAAAILEEQQHVEWSAGVMMTLDDKQLDLLARYSCEKVETILNTTLMKLHEKGVDLELVASAMNAGDGQEDELYRAIFSVARTVVVQGKAVAKYNLSCAANIRFINATVKSDPLRVLSIFLAEVKQIFSMMDRRDIPFFHLLVFQVANSSE
jgi:hypothetical protein